MIMGKMILSAKPSTLKNGLVGYYDMEHSTQFENRVTGTLTSYVNVSHNTSGKIGSSKTLGVGWSYGYSHPIYEYTFTPYQKLSVSAWIYRRGSSNTEIFRCYNEGLGASTVSFWFQDANVFFDCTNGSNLFRVYRVNALPLNQWVHLVLTYDGYPSVSNVKLYQNGVDVSLTVASSTVVSNNTPSYSQIGPGLVCSFDEMGIYNRVLNQAEITQLYNNGAGLTYANL